MNDRRELVISDAEWERRVVGMVDASEIRWFSNFSDEAKFYAFIEERYGKEAVTKVVLMNNRAPLPEQGVL